MKNKKWTFKTVKELVKFVKELEDNPVKVLDVNYFKLTAVLRDKQNRKLENESDTYLYREIGVQDTLSLMKITEKNQHPSDTAWMLKIPITVTNKKGETNEDSN